MPQEGVLLAVLFMLMFVFHRHKKVMTGRKTLVVDSLNTRYQAVERLEELCLLFKPALVNQG
jgi:hypothetical protein